MLPTTIRLFLIWGRLVGFATAVLTFALMVWWGQNLLRYAFFHEDPMWGEVGLVPLVIVLRLLIVAWVAWNVVKLEGRDLLPALLAAFGASFFLLFGWYFLLTGMDWGFLYWVVACDLLYLAAGLLVGCALLLVKTDARPRDVTT
jgi:hypothetical protein